MDEATARLRLYRLGAERYRDRLMLAWARSGDEADRPRWRELVSLPERWSVPNFPLKAADFVARGIAAGPALGHVLALAEGAWLAAEFPFAEAALEAIADQYRGTLQPRSSALNIRSGFAILISGMVMISSALQHWVRLITGSRSRGLDREALGEQVAHENGTLQRTPAAGTSPGSSPSATTQGW